MLDAKKVNWIAQGNQVGTGLIITEHGGSREEVESKIKAHLYPVENVKYYHTGVDTDARE